MTLHAALAAAATLVSLAFALCTLERHLARRARAGGAARAGGVPAAGDGPRHELVWTISLLLFSAGSIGLWAGAAVGWNEVTFKAFYLFGAVLNVPFLALGTVYLLGGRRTGDRWTAVVSLLAAFAAGIVIQAPLLASLDPEVLPRGPAVFGPGPRIAAAVGSGVASLVIVGGALWSAARLVRARRAERRSRAAASGAAVPARPHAIAPGRLAVANLCIATGTLVAAAAGLFNSVLNEMDAFAVALVAGITIVFAGFLLTASAPEPPEIEWHPPAPARPATASHPRTPERARRARELH